jgi:hypothetical protein
MTLQYLSLLKTSWSGLTNWPEATSSGNSSMTRHEFSHRTSAMRLEGIRNIDPLSAR